MSVLMSQEPTDLWYKEIKKIRYYRGFKPGDFGQNKGH